MYRKKTPVNWPYFSTSQIQHQNVTPQWSTLEMGQYLALRNVRNQGDQSFVLCWHQVNITVTSYCKVQASPGPLQPNTSNTLCHGGTPAVLSALEDPAYVASSDGAVPVLAVGSTCCQNSSGTGTRNSPSRHWIQDLQAILKKLDLKSLAL